MSKMQRKILFFLIILVSIFPLIFWYQPGHLIYLGDLNYPLNPILYWASKLTQTWNSTFPGGATHSQAPTLFIYQGLSALLSLMHFSLALAQSIFYTGWILASSVAFAFFAEQLRKKIQLGIVFTYVGVVLYQFNIYRMIMFGDAAHNAIYVALPLVLGLILLSEDKRQARYAALAGLAMIVAAPAGANPPMFATFAVLLAVLLIYFFLVSRQKIQTLLRYGLFLLSFITSGLFWILPFLSGQLGALKADGLGQNNLANWVDSVSVNSSFMNILRMQGAWDWYAGFDNKPYVAYAHIYQNHPFFVWWALILPAVGLLALLLRRKYWGFGVIMASVGVAGLLLSMGTHEPMTKSFHWAIEHVPLFWMFRSPWYKFGLWQSFATVILVAITLDIVSSFILKHVKKSTIVLAPLGICLVIAATVSVYPLITGIKFPQKEARLSIPDYVLSNSQAIDSSVQGEIVLLPNVPAFNYRWQWSGLLDPLFYTTTNKLLYTAMQIGSEGKAPSRGWLYDSFACQLYRSDGALAARGILNWLRPQAILQRDDMNEQYYGANKGTPEFMVSAINAIGYKHEDPTVKAPWHLFPTYFKHEPLRLADSIIYTPDLPSAVLAPLAELGHLSPNATFIHDKEALDTISHAGLPYYEVHAIGTDKPQIVNNGSVVSYGNVTPGAYILFVKQSSATEPQLTISDQKVAWTQISPEWWKSSPVKLLNGGPMVLPSSKTPQEHAASFATPLAWNAENVNPNAPGVPMFSQTLSTEEDNGIILTAAAQKLMYKHALTGLIPKRLYRLTFDYKTDGENPAEYSLYQAEIGKIALNQGLPATTQWKTVSEVFRAELDVNHTYINLFSFTNKPGQLATQYYRNVSVQEVTPIETIIAESQIPQSLATYQDFEFGKVKPSEITAITPTSSQARVITFDQNYADGWRLTSTVQAIKIRANWYENAWVMPPGANERIVIKYNVQRYFEFGLVISALAIFITVTKFVQLRRAHRKIKRHEKA